LHHLQAKDLSSAYGPLTVLRGVNLTLAKGEVVALIGPSGSGKSTVLRVLMGLARPTGGEVLVDGTAIDYRSPASVRAARGRMAIVFQQYNLFQNMDAMRNVTIAPVKIQRRPRREVEAEASRLLAKVGLADKHQAYPD
jgi:polar amino acid transport system ATP-binding protein